MPTRHARFWRAKPDARRGPLRFSAFYGWCVLLLASFFAANAMAASTARIVLVASGNAELARKVRAEAEHVGISIATEGGAGSAGDAELVRRHGAVGVVELVSPDR